MGVAYSAPLCPSAVLSCYSCSDLFAPIVATLANKSFNQGNFPACFKSAQVKPILKKKGLDETNLSNYRPISNLNTISKIIEKLFLTRLQKHVAETGNFNSMQSGFRANHSTETALQSVLNDIYRSIDDKKLTLLVALDISAAFDALEHSILIRRLEHTFGISGLALRWIESYLAGRTQFVKIGDETSERLSCEFGVPQGSVLGPMLFALHVSPIACVIEKAGLKHHQYADDTQLYISFKSSDQQQSILTAEQAANDVRGWFINNGLQLNPDKTEAMFLGTSQNLSSVADTDNFSMSGSVIKITDTIKSLGVHIDSRLTFEKRVSEICRASYSNIKALKKLRSSLDQETAKTVACAIVSARLDYCNSVLYGTTVKNLSKLQRVQNSLARVVTGCRRSDHITPVLKDLHWLPIRERIHYKISCMTYKVKHSGEPSYLAEQLLQYIPSRNLRSSNQNKLVIPFIRTKTASRAFSVAAPVLWNELPDCVANAPSVSNFCSSLKTFLFSKAFKTVSTL